MNLHVSVIGFAVFLCYFLIAGFFLRWVSAKYHDTAWGKALLFIH